MVAVESYLPEIEHLPLDEFCRRHPQPLLVQQGSPSILVAELYPRRVHESVVTIGIGEDCDVRLAEPSVSSVHAWFTEGVGGWFLWDNDSRLGTFVDDRRLPPVRPVALACGARITLGTLELRFLAAEAFYERVTARWSRGLTAPAYN